MRGKRGQVSTEYIMITGILLFFLIVLVSFSYDRTNETLKINKLAESLEAIDAAIDGVSALGVYNKEVVLVDFPKGILNITINNTQFNIQIYSFSEKSDFYIEPPLGIYLQGNLTKGEGSHHIKLEMLNATDINISE